MCSPMAHNDTKVKLKVAKFYFNISLSAILTSTERSLHLVKSINYD